MGVGMRVEKSTGKIYARVTRTIDGRRVERTRQINSIKDAKKVGKELAEELAKETPKTIQMQNATLAELLDYYDRKYAVPPTYVDGRKVAGLRSHRKIGGQIKVLKAHFGKKLARSITYGDLNDFKLARFETKIKRKDGEKQRSIAAVNRELSLLKRVFRVAVQCEWIRASPFDAGDCLISCSDETKRVRTLSPSEEVKLLSDDDKLRFPLLCALDAGMRKGEITSMRWNDINLEERRINLLAFNTKTMAARSVPISNRMAQEILSIRAMDTSRVFANAPVISYNFRRLWERALVRHEIADMHFHDLRSTFATRIIQKGLPIAEVARLLGHTKVETTYRYVTPDTGSLIERALKYLD